MHKLLVPQVAKELNVLLIGYGTSKSIQLHSCEVIASIANRLERSQEQIVLRWMYQKRIISIPKSSNPTRQVANADIFCFELSPSDMEAMDHLNQNHPYYWDPTPSVLATETVIPNRARARRQASNNLKDDISESSTK